MGTPKTHRRFLNREDGSYGPIPSRRPLGMLGMPFNRTAIKANPPPSGTVLPALAWLHSLPDDASRILYAAVVSLSRILKYLPSYVIVNLRCILLEPLYQTIEKHASKARLCMRLCSTVCDRMCNKSFVSNLCSGEVDAVYGSVINESMVWPAGIVLCGRQYISRAGRERGGVFWLWLCAPGAL